MEYFNKILNKKTNHKYRFKVREEFENEYGEDWAQTIRCNWYDDDIEGMNYLFGTNINFLSLEKIEDIINHNGIAYCDDDIGNSWSISKDMLIQNDLINFKHIYLKNDNKLVYENKILKFNEYKKGD